MISAHTKDSDSTPQPEAIGSVALWVARLHLNTPMTCEQLQEKITKYVEDSGITVVGAYAEADNTFTMLCWPETREDYQQVSIEQCERALHDLKDILDVQKVDKGFMPNSYIHCMMGLRIGGYDDDNHQASIADVKPLAGRLSTQSAYMISARQTTDKGVQSYGEPVVILTGPPDAISEVHTIGDMLQQHHYAIEDTAQGQTTFYETRWATSEA